MGLFQLCMRVKKKKSSNALRTGARGLCFASDLIIVTFVIAMSQQIEDRTCAQCYVLLWFIVWCVVCVACFRFIMSIQQMVTSFRKGRDTQQRNNRIII